MAGKETSGIKHAEANLFEGATTDLAAHAVRNLANDIVHFI